MRGTGEDSSVTLLGPEALRCCLLKHSQELQPGLAWVPCGWERLSGGICPKGAFRSVDEPEEGGEQQGRKDWKGAGQGPRVRHGHLKYGEQTLPMALAQPSCRAATLAHTSPQHSTCAGCALSLWPWSRAGAMVEDPGDLPRQN